MKKLILFLCASLLTSIVAQGKTVAIIPQWHLLPEQRTMNLAEGAKLPQYPNQKSIFLILKEWVSKGQIQAVVAEGCEGQIDHHFKVNFNGWDYLNLIRLAKDPKYAEIMTHVPLKVEAIFRDKVLTLCGDTNQLIKSHSTVFSDIRGYIGFYGKFKSIDPTSKAYTQYVDALNQLAGKKVANPLAYIEQELDKLLKLETELMHKRNDNFVKVISATSRQKVAVVIGKRHVEDLFKKLNKTGVNVVIVNELDHTLPKEDNLAELRKILKQKFK